MNSLMQMKTVLITGASGNLGKVVVEKFIQNDFQVLATVSPGKKWDGVLSKNLHLVEVDLADEQNVKRAIQHWTTTTSVQAAFFLAGGYASGDITNTTGAVIHQMLSINFETAFYIGQELFNHMVQQNQGRLVFIGARPSLSAAHGKSSIAYGLSKTLVMKFAEYLNAAGSDNNILSHVIVPSTIDTPANRAAMPEADFSRWVRPEDIAETLLFLCSPASASFRDVVIKMYNRA